VDHASSAGRCQGQWERHNPRLWSTNLRYLRGLAGSCFSDDDHDIVGLHRAEDVGSVLADRQV
jgi:hypothetical protein